VSEKQQAGILLAMVIGGLAWLQCGRPPLLGLLMSAVLHLRAAGHWVRHSAGPALQVAASRYDESLEEVRRWR